MANPFKAIGRGVKRIFGRGGEKDRSFSNRAGEAAPTFRGPERVEVREPLAARPVGHAGFGPGFKEGVKAEPPRSGGRGAAGGSAARRFANRMGKPAPTVGSIPRTEVQPRFPHPGAPARPLHPDAAPLHFQSASAMPQGIDLGRGQRYAEERGRIEARGGRTRTTQIMRARFGLSPARRVTR